MLDFMIQKAYAQIASPSGSNSNITFNKLLANVKDQIVTPVIWLLFALAIVYFVWGVVIFIKNADNAEKRQEGYMHMIWGVIGAFIMLSAKGLINIILATFGIK